MTSTEQRIALVTGARSGIGKATAAKLEQQGCVVYRFDRAWEKEHPLRFAGDVADESDWKELAQRIQTQHGRLDALINSAGILREASLADTTASMFQELFTVNVIGLFLGCREMLPLLEKSKTASIVNMGSVDGLRGSFNHSAYAASKGAVISFSRALALELAGRGIRVNSVCPGTVDTPMVQAMINADSPFAERNSLHPLGKRLATADEQANAIAFLSSPEASFITGVSLSTDGGRSIR